MAAGGLMKLDDDGCKAVMQAPDPLHAVRSMDFAKALLAEARKVVLPGEIKATHVRHSTPNTDLSNSMPGEHFRRVCRHNLEDMI